MDSEQISDQDLLELLGGDLEQDVPEEATPEPQPLAESVEAAPSQPEQVAAVEPEAPEVQQEAPQPDNWNPEGPGDMSKAVQAKNREIAELKERNAAYEAHFQQQQQEQQQPFEALDPEAHALYQQQIEGLRNETQQQIQQVRIQQSAEFARQSIPDYEQKMAKLVELQGDPVLGPMIQAAEGAILSSPNPALAAVQLVDRLSGPSPQDIQAQIQQGITKALDALKNPEKPTAPKTVGSIPAAAPNDQGLDLGNLTKADIKKHGLNILDMLE